MPNKVIIPGIQDLFNYGHFRNPAMPTGVTQDDLPGLQWHDAVVKTALKSWQDFMKAEIDRLAVEIHGRTIDVDGDLGPATAKSFELPRCGMPDYQMAGVEEANWPTGCRGKLKFGRSFKALPGLTKEQTDQCFWAMSNNWFYATKDVVINVAEPGDKSGCHIYADLKNLGGSTLAWSYLAQNNCNVQLAQAYDTGRTWSLRLGSPVASHEVGHALGLSHNRDSRALMYPSIHQYSQERYGYPNATDLSDLRSLGYTLSGGPAPSIDNLFKPRPHGPTVPPTDPPTEPDGEYWIRGTVDHMKGDTVVGQQVFSKPVKV